MKLPNFVNRRDEVSLIRTLIRQKHDKDLNGKNGINFWGVAGIGKSSLLNITRDKICPEEETPCAYIDFSEPKYRTHELSKIVVLEDIIEQLAAYSGDRIVSARFTTVSLKCKSLYRQSDSNDLNALEKALLNVAFEFNRSLHLFLNRQSLLLLFDATEEAKSILDWLELNIIRSLIDYPEFLLILAGRFKLEWNHSIRGKIQSESLSPFTVDAVKEQIPDYAHLAQSIIEFTSGHPIANVLIAQKLSELQNNKTDPLKEDDLLGSRHILIESLRNNFINQQLLSKIPDELVYAFRAVIPIRHFNVSLLTMLLPLWQPPVKPFSTSHSFALKLIQQMQITGFVYYNANRPANQAIDTCIRRLLDIDTFLDFKDQYIATIETTIQYYQRALNIGSKNEINDLLELLYCWAKLLKLEGNKPQLIVDKLIGFVIVYLKDVETERVWDLVTSLSHEIKLDNELSEICGIEIDRLSEVIEGITHWESVTDFQESSSDQAIHTFAVSAIELHGILVNKFNDDEIRTLCLELMVDYDELLGDNKSGKARELIYFMDRRERTEELIKVVRQLRPSSANRFT